MSYIKKLDVGNIKLNNNVFLAPMAGVTDIAFRKIVREVSSPALTFTEMASSKAMEFGSNKTEKLLKIPEYERPSAVQIFGSNKTVISDTIKKLNEDENIDIIDINMGCPVRKIVGTGDGSALMKSPEKAKKIVSSVVGAVGAEIPVTVKIRTGFDGDTLNAVSFAVMLEQAGVSAICIHGRTREQMYAPPIDLNTIADVKKAVSVPVIGNGGIYSGADARRMFEYTGCDAVMIGQGACGNPWIFEEITSYIEGRSYIAPQVHDRINLAKTHTEMLIADKGLHIGICESRKHISWYIKGIPGSARIRDLINRSESKENVFSLLDELERDARIKRESFSDDLIV